MIWQLPALNVQVPISVVPSLNVTSPATKTASVTKAVKVKELPTVAVSGAVSVVIVTLDAGSFITCVNEAALVLNKVAPR